MTSAEALARECRWSSWDGNPDRLSREERDELCKLLGVQNLWKVKHGDLQAGADLLAEHYNKVWREAFNEAHLEARRRRS